MNNNCAEKTVKQERIGEVDVGRLLPPCSDRRGAHCRLGASDLRLNGCRKNYINVWVIIASIAHSNPGLMQ